MLSLILAPSGYGKTHSVINEINEVLDKNEGRKIYLIVPEQESVKTEAELLEFCGNRINADVEVINFSRLANRVFREAGGMTYSYIDKSGKDLITAVLVERLKKACPSFEKVGDDTSYIQLLRTEMDTLRSRGYHSNDIEKVRLKLIEEDRGGSSLALKLEDFATLFASYEKSLSDNISDTTDDIARLATTLDEFDFFEDSYVYIDGFYDYTKPQYDVIERIMRSADKLTVTFSMQRPDPEGIFRKTGKAFDTIRELAEKNEVEYRVTELENNYRTQSNGLRALAEAIMSGREIKAESKGEVRLSALETPYDECVYVAREIVRLAKNGADFSEIAVTASNIASYASTLENVFDSYGIPHLNCCEKSVLQMPVISLVMTALSVIESGFYYENVKGYLKSSYLGLDEEEAYLLENYVTLWCLGKKSWLDEKEWKLHPRGYVESFTSADTRELEVVNRARAKVFPPLKILFDGFSERSTVRQKAESMVEYFESLSLWKKVEEVNREISGELERDNFDEEISAWNSLLTALDMLVEGAGDLQVGRARFIKYLRLVLGDMSFGKIPSSLDEVEIGDVEFVRNKNIKHLFFIGFNEGIFPSAVESKSIFTETEKRWLIENELKLDESAEEKLQDQSFDFLLSVLRASHSVDFVYHTSSAEGSKAESLPSYFSATLEDVLGVIPEKRYNLISRPVTEDELSEYIITTDEDISRLFTTPEGKKLYEDAIKLKSFAELVNKPFHIDSDEPIIPDEYRLTQSRLERYEKCRFSFFVEYMLNARVRKKAEFSRAEIGSYVHKILELVLKEFSKDDGNITDATDAEIEKATRRIAKEYVAEIASDINENSPKYRYLLDNICSFVLLIVSNIRAEFAASLFKPKYFEEDIRTSDAVKPYEVKLNDGGTLYFTGVIDRVDVYVDGDGVEYIRVVDYKTKTGGKSFSLEDVLNGMNLQMLIYLYAFTKTPAKRERREAGIMYMPASKEEFKATDVEQGDEVLRGIIDKNLRRSGMYLDDRRIIDAMEEGREKRFVNLKYDKKNDEYVAGASSTLATLEDFGIIQRYIDTIFCDVMENLKSGNIEPNPIEDNSAGGNVCSYCQYHSICRYEGEIRERIKCKTPLARMKEELDKA